MSVLELRWSRRKQVLYLLGALAVAAYAAVATSEEIWKRILFVAMSAAVALGLGSRLRVASEPVIVLSGEGVRDSRLSPEFVPWSAIESARYEPSYARGGATLLDLKPGVPVPSVHNPPLTTRTQQASVTKRSLRLTLGDLAFSPDAVRDALAKLAPAAAR